MRFGLSEATIGQICQVFERYPQISQAILYGSRAIGDYRNGSDIDLTLRGDSDLTRQMLAKIANELDGLYIPYTVDLSAYHELNDPNLSQQIEEVGLLFYEKGLVSPNSP